MRIDQSFIELLSCLDCGNKLDVDDIADFADDGHVMSGNLVCHDCDLHFPIRGGVPRLVPSNLSNAVKHDMDGWSYEWEHVKPLTENTPLNAADTFLDFIYPITPDYFRGKTVIDAGCGSGRFSRWAAEFGAAVVVGVDLSESVNIAFANLRRYPNVLIVQADLLRLPMIRNFDYAFSIGVLDHTSDPSKAFDSVSSLVTPGGGVSTWVYGREGNGWIVKFLNPFRLRVTSHLPRTLLLGLCYLLVAIMFPFLQAIYKPIGNYKFLAPFKKILFYFDYLNFLSKFKLNEQAYIAFDHLAPGIVEYISKSEIEEWYSESGLDDIEITSRNGNSWRGFALIPEDRGIQ